MIYGVVVAFILGACLGSFLNCAAIRIVKEEDFVRGRSHCVSCGHDLGLLDLVPIFSWLFLRGRCRYCGAGISARYPLAELVFALVSVACLLCFDVSLLALRNYIFLAVLFLLTLTDLDAMMIPDRCHIIAALVWGLAAPLLLEPSEIISHLAAGLIFGGGVMVLSLIMDKFMGRETMGGGDIKLLAVVGLYLGIIGSLLALILACVLGLIASLIQRSRAGSAEEEGSDEAGEDGDDDGAGEDGKAFPFGPWIAVAAAVVLFAGDPVIGWYMGLMG